MERKTPLTIEWLEKHGFTKNTGMRPAAEGDSYSYRLGKSESIYINTTGGSWGRLRFEIYKNHNNNVSIEKPWINEEALKAQVINDKLVNDKGETINPHNQFYLEELIYLLELSNNENLIDFFKD